MGGQVTHPRQLEDHPDRGDYRAQLARHGGLEGQQGQAAILQLLMHVIELGVVRYDSLSAGQIGIEQGG